MKQYEKIDTIYERSMSGSKKLIEGAYRDETIRYLKDLTWEWTEKIDGTNVRVHWDGHKIEFGGRTDSANIPAPLVNRLNELFGGETNAQMLEQIFGEKDVIFFGEGFGRKIQAVGAKYLPDSVDFILFDVSVNNIYLPREGVENLATVFNLRCVPVVLRADVDNAVRYVKTRPMSTIGDAPMEGLEGRPMAELQDRNGKRIITKIKVKDFAED